MKVIILVQSSDNPEYVKLKEAQQLTWDSITHSNIDTIYYKRNGKSEEIIGNIINTPENEEWITMYKSFVKALRLLLKQDWDYVFKTDNSAYVDKDVLYNLLLTKPKDNYFGGMTFPYSLPDADKHVWGEGFAISRDIAKYIVDDFNKCPFLYSGIEDGVVSKVLKNKTVFDDTLHVYELYKHDGKIEPGNHVYRVRVEHSNFSPAFIKLDTFTSMIDSDIQSMHNIHSVIKKK